MVFLYDGMVLTGGMAPGSWNECGPVAIEWYNGNSDALLICISMTTCAENEKKTHENALVI